MATPDRSGLQGSQGSAAALGSADDSLRVALERAIGFQYDVIRLLGRGGMGAVYHAHEKALDRPVAIKVLPPDVATGEARERFLREARTAAHLTHPHIVPLLTFGETSGIVYYVMGYVDGESLEQRLRRQGKLDPESAARILGQLAGALDYAHQQGIVHRDVKPDNVLIERGTGVAKLTDFGIAKRAAAGETLTGTGLLMGTPRYMSPEQASGDRDLDARSDVYALGLVGWAMLTGRPPFDGASVQEILTQQVTREPPNLRALVPELPSPIAVAIERALRKEPAQRWGSASLMAEALDEDTNADEGAGIMSMRKPGTYAITSLITVVVMTDLAWWAGVSAGNPWLAYLMLFSLLGGVYDYWSLRHRQKLPRTEVRRIMTEPPRWWPFWWPEGWRRADDVWPRLPRALRRIRAASNIGVGVFVLTLHAIFIALSLAPKSPWAPIFLGAAFAGMITTLVSLVGSWIGARRWGRAQGLTSEQASTVAAAPTSHPKFWKQSWIARLLIPAAKSAESREPETPRALADAIAAIVAQLAPPQRESVAGAVDASRNLVIAIDALDAEASILMRDADPAEIARLEARMAALGAESASDSPGQREMRQLYTTQRDLLRRLARQAEDLATRRTRHGELLRTLWLQLSTLRAEQAADAMRVDDVTGRIRHIVQSVERDVQGAREVARLA